jgi:formylglycine-generating enzyme
LALALAVVGVLSQGCSEDDGGSSAVAEAGCSSTRGPAMARLALDVDTFCIDRTEVTRAQYAAFVADGAPTGTTVPAQCKVAPGPHVPDEACGASPALCQGAACGDYPQTCVSFCDAAAYCAWSGKELCGEIGGGYGLRQLTDSKNGGRWTTACGGGIRPGSAGVARLPYSYGLTYSPDRCNTETQKCAAVGSSPECSLSTDGTVVDMIGNVAELTGILYVQSASGAIGPYAHGGAGFDFFSGKGGQCESVAVLNDIDERQPGIGFRCCKNVD